VHDPAPGGVQLRSQHARRPLRTSLPGKGCECLIGDTLVGRCEVGDETCGIFDGCCAGVFFTAPN